MKLYGAKIGLIGACIDGVMWDLPDQSLSNAVRAVAATTSDNAANEALISYARDVVSLSRTLLPEAQDAAHYSSNAKRDQCLAACAKEVNAALSKCLDCLPGQRNLDLAVSRICARSLDMSLMQVCMPLHCVLCPVLCCTQYYVVETESVVCLLIS